MKKLATASCLALALAPAVSFAGGEVGPVIAQPQAPVAVPVAVGGVGGAPLEVAAAGAIPAGAIIAAGAGLLGVAALVALLSDDDDDDGPSGTSGTN